jgi:predicted SAM-dependent methyltransferase
VNHGLNVGSGQRPFTSTESVLWTNIDAIAHEGMPAPDLVCDGAHLPYSGSVVDYFVLHQVAEHYHCNESTALIEEAWRVLKPGGSLLVFVPDLRALAKRWLEGGLSTQIYVTNLYGAYMGHPEDCHYWGFDQASLLEYLGKCSPWREVKRFDWRHISGADLANDFWVAHAECVK